jgi:hypothetical protein
MCSCSNKATSTPIQREKNKISKKVKTTIPHQPLPRLLLLLNALLLAQLAAVAIECSVRNFLVSHEISISLVFFLYII